MAQSAGLHEPEKLSAATMDRHRAITSLARGARGGRLVRPAGQRHRDAELAAVLAHNRDEEKEHAAMTLEWLRRQDPTLDRHLRTYLFTALPVTEVEARPRRRSQWGRGSTGR